MQWGTGDDAVTMRVVRSIVIERLVLLLERLAERAARSRTPPLPRLATAGDTAIEATLRRFMRGVGLEFHQRLAKACVTARVQHAGKKQLFGASRKRVPVERPREVATAAAHQLHQIREPRQNRRRAQRCNHGRKRLDCRYQALSDLQHELQHG
jgi:hypothetical protein